MAGVPPMRASPLPHTSASLYVGDLKPEVTEARLFKIFSAVGPVASIRVCRDAVTRKSLKYAYVNFHSVDDAARAIETMNYTHIEGHPCRIMRSQRNPSIRKAGIGNIFVKNLDPTIDNKTLSDTFSMFGDILSCKVQTDLQGVSRGYGFVHYSNQESADRAVEKVNGMDIAGKKVYVAHFKSKKVAAQTQTMVYPDGANVRRTFTNVFIKNMPPDWDEKNMTDLAGQCGLINSSYIKTDNKTGRKFGAVNFAEPENATKCIEKLNGFRLERGDESLFVTRAQKKSEREKELQKKIERAKRENQKKYHGVNLYVKNLSDRVDDEVLHNLFAPFGTITSAKVMLDPQTEKSRGFGFVCFTSKEMASMAINDLNSKLIDGKPLYVAYAQRKDERREVLEAQARSRAEASHNKTGFFNRPGMTPHTPGIQRMGPHFVGQPVGHPNWGAQGGNPILMGQTPGFGRSVMQGQPPMMVPNQSNHFMMNQSSMHHAQQASAREAAYGSTPRDQHNKNIAAELANADPEQQKQMIGERIFPLVQPIEPRLAGKITGMLLEMDNTELLHLVDSPEALKHKINEALQVLKTYKSGGGSVAVE